MSTTPRVLVVDDDNVVRAVLRRVFLDAGLRVELFDSARALLAAADFGRAAVLLLDARMPHMSGLELQALLSAQGVDLPVMFLSGGADIPVAVAAMRAGAVDFLEKPSMPPTWSDASSARSTGAGPTRSCRPFREKTTRGGLRA